MLLKLRFISLFLLILLGLNVKVFAQSHALFTSPARVCENDTIVFRSHTVLQGETATDYSWDIYGNGNYISTGLVDTLFHVYSTAELDQNFNGQHQFNVKLKVTTNLNNTLISPIKLISISYLPRIINSSIPYFQSEVCQYDSTTFFNNYFVAEGSIANTYWYFNDQDETYTQSYFKRSFDSTGFVNLKIVAITDNNCKTTTLGTFLVKELPAGTLSYSGDTTFFDDKSITIKVDGVYNSVVWNTGEITPSVTVNKTGIYSVTLHNIQGCKADLTSSKITVYEKQPVGAMNLLTLNDDGKNDTWKIFDRSAYGTCEVNVFNRNGQVVYSSDNYQNDWKGTDKDGNKLPTGAYYYTIKASDVEGIYKANLNILH